MTRWSLPAIALGGLAAVALLLIAAPADAQGWGCGTPRTGSGTFLNADVAGDYTGGYGIAADWCRAGAYDDGVNLYNVFTMNTYTTPTAAEHVLATQYRAYFGVGTTGPGGGQAGECWDTRLDWFTPTGFAGTLLANQGCQLINNGAATPGSFTGRVYCNEIHAVIPLTSLGIVPPGTGTDIEYGMWVGTAGNGFYVYPWGTYQPGSNTALDQVAGTPNVVYTLGAPYNLYQPAPTGVTATATGDNNVTVSWTAPTQSSEAQQIRWYRVYRSVNGGPFNFLGQTSGPGTSYIDTAFPVQGPASTLDTYEYRVSSVNCDQLPVQAGAVVGGESLMSPISNAVTPDFRPEAPVMDLITTYGSASVTLSWTSPADRPTGGTGVASYRVFRSATSPVTTASTVVCTVTAPALTCNDLTVSPSTTYYYAVQAEDGYAAGPNRGALSNQRNVQTLAAEVPAQALLQALTVLEGGSGPITDEAHLKYAFSGGPSSIQFELVSLPANGQLMRGGTPLIVGTNQFTQSDINNDVVTYVHDGSETTTDSFRFIAREPTGGGAVERTFSIIIVPVNDAPTITAPSALSSLEDAGPVTIPFATAWGPSEVGQAIITRSVLSVTNSALFTTAPVWNTDGTLSFQTAPNAYGTSQITVRLKDNGGTANGGVDTTDFTVTLTVINVNDAPDFSVDQSLVYADWDWTIGEATYPGFFQLVTFGPAENGAGGQAISSITVTPADMSLFDQLPTIDPVTGDLVYKPKPQVVDPRGTEPETLVTVSLKDNGGTANGGVDATTKTFTLRLREPNTPPLAGDDTFEVWRHLQVPLDVLINDEDTNVPKDPLVVSSITPVMGDGLVRGVAVWDPVDNVIRFTPTPGAAWQGVATFDYTIFDGRDGYATATVTLTVEDPVDPAVLIQVPTGLTCKQTPLAFAASGHYVGSGEDGFPTAWAWDFGDGTTASDAAGWLSEVEHTFTTAGTYTVTATASFATAPDATTTVQFTVMRCQAPPADFTYAAFGRDIEFSGPSGAYTYAWEFGDGATGTGVAPVHTYATSGIYSVRLTVTDDEGFASSQTKSVVVPAHMGTVDPWAVTVDQVIEVPEPTPVPAPQPTLPPATPNRPPVADAGADARVPGQALVYLDGGASYDPEGAALRYTWQQSMGPSVELFDADSVTAWFVAPYGTELEFTLTVSDGVLSHQDRVRITVSAAPKAVDWVGRPDGRFWSFEAFGVADGARLSWSFGDGTTSTDARPIHEYKEPGTYEVRLVVDDGTQHESSRLVTVAFAPTVADENPAPQATAAGTSLTPYLMIGGLGLLLLAVAVVLVLVLRRR